MNRTLVSVIMPCYNHGRYLTEAIQSVLAQTYTTWELIIVDDGSSDNTADVAKEFASKDERISYIYQENAGPSSARNAGVKVSRGKYLQFLDGDDKLSPFYLEYGIGYLSENEDCSLFYSRCEYFGEKCGEFVLRYIDYKNLLCANSIDMACMIPKSLFESVGGFDEDMCGYEDWELFIRLLYHNDKVYQHPSVLFYYRAHKNSGSVNQMAIKKNKSIRTYIYNKHFDKYVEYFGEPFEVYSRCVLLEKGIEDLRHSRTYRLGKFLLWPLNVLKQKCNF